MGWPATGRAGSGPQAWGPHGSSRPKHTQQRQVGVQGLGSDGVLSPASSAQV